MDDVNAITVSVEDILLTDAGEPSDQAQAGAGSYFESKAARYESKTHLQAFYAKWVIPIILSIWLLGVLVVLAFFSRKVFCVNGEEVLWVMPTTVQAILAGTTTVNLIGVLYVVVNYLFDGKSD